MIMGWRRLCAWGGLALVMLLPSCTGEAGPAIGCHGGWHVQTGPADADGPDQKREPTQPTRINLT